ncbi:hypothetical protein G4G30_15945 [Stenotrophomonas maltophilia]|nr:hypothetical protein G4G30_15945 [Stenotrophomonas maltophilia]
MGEASAVPFSTDLEATGGLAQRRHAGHLQGGIAERLLVDLLEQFRGPGTTSTPERARTASSCLFEPTPAERKILWMRSTTSSRQFMEGSS